MKYIIWKYLPLFIKKIIFNKINKNKNIWFWSIQLTDILNKNIKIWDFTYIDKWAQIFAKNCAKICIWKYCSIAHWVYIISYNHNINIVSPHINQVTHKIKLNNDVIWKEINIWNDVWIWVNSIILPWINIWDWAIIWAWSIVTKDVPSYSIYWWNPAKLIKKRFNENIINELINIKWWNWKIQKIKENKKFFSINLEQFEWNFKNIIK